jgi:hypothetical protein
MSRPASSRELPQSPDEPPCFGRRIEHASLACWHVGVDTAGVDIDRQRFGSAAILTRWASYLQPFYVGSPTFGQ